MLALFRTIFLTLFCSVVVCQAADIPAQRLQTTTLPQINQSAYYWKATSVGDTAQLVALFCRSCNASGNEQEDQPLIAILRDTLGDNNPENDRVTYVWLLGYSHPNVGKRILSAVPFFYWRIDKGSTTASAHDTAPFFDLTAPQHPVASELGRDLLQWTLFDPMTTAVRATSRAYRSNQLDDERLHLEEAISYLRRAPVSPDDSALTKTELDTVVARLELRKRLLGGLVGETRAERIGQESLFEDERIRSRNWELLRECAERTGLYFESLDLGGTSGEYAILWFPLHSPPEPAGASLKSVWKLLNIRSPWSDDRLAAWKGPVYTRALDENGSLLPTGAQGARQLQLIPLGVYSLSYPKLPLLLIDFRDTLHVRWHEMTQRSINEITAGVIGISHFTNWYYYVAADLYDFVVDRHGAAMNQTARLDCYSRFRVAVALDRQADPSLRKEIQRRIDSLAINPLEAVPERELQASRARYALLEAEAADGTIVKRLDKQRRTELAYFEESKKARVVRDLLHDGTFGLYTHRARPDEANLDTLDSYRRVEYHLHFLDSLVEAGTQPEVAYDSSRIEASVTELGTLMPDIGSPALRARASLTLERLRSLSQDESLQANCSLTLLALKRRPAVLDADAASGIVTRPRTVSMGPSDSVKSIK